MPRCLTFLGCVLADGKTVSGFVTDGFLDPCGIDVFRMQIARNSCEAFNALTKITGLNRLRSFRLDHPGLLRGLPEMISRDFPDLRSATSQSALRVIFPADDGSFRFQDFGTPLQQAQHLRYGKPWVLEKGKSWPLDMLAMTPLNGRRQVKLNTLNLISWRRDDPALEVLNRVIDCKVNAGMYSSAEPEILLSLLTFVPGGKKPAQEIDWDAAARLSRKLEEKGNFCLNLMSPLKKDLPPVFAAAALERLQNLCWEKIKKTAPGFDPFYDADKAELLVNGFELASLLFEARSDPLSFKAEKVTGLAEKAELKFRGRVLAPAAGQSVHHACSHP